MAVSTSKSLILAIALSLGGNFFSLAAISMAK